MPWLVFFYVKQYCTEVNTSVSDRTVFVLNLKSDYSSITSSCHCNCECIAIQCIDLFCNWTSHFFLYSNELLVLHTCESFTHYIKKRIVAITYNNPVHIMRQTFVRLFQSHVNAAGRIGRENKHIAILEIAEQLINFILLAAITVATR